VKKDSRITKVARFPTAILVVLSFLIVPPTLARAEWFGDIYLGVASTEDGEIFRSTLGASSTERHSFDNSFIIGIRGGRWLENKPWLGLAIDYSIFSTNIDYRDVFVSPISFLAMVRMQLMESAEFPRGRLQPYFYVGHALFYSKLNSFSPAPWGPLKKTGDFDTSIDVGLDLRFGLTWSITHNLALFGEYRFSNFKPEFGEDIYGMWANLETELTIHHGLAGISYHF
jgi:opacity protein-like surface antigen